jgi:cation:H+ antiporter
VVLGAAIAAFVVGAVVCLGTSWLLVTRLERVGERFGFSEALLGMLAALAADTPEITAAIAALGHHERAVGAGVVVGSNVFNLAALLGLGAVVGGRLGLHRKVILLGGAVGLWMATVCLITVERVIAPGLGFGLALAVLAAYVVVLGTRQSGLRQLPLPRRWIAWMASAVDEEELELVVAIRPERGRPQDALTALGALVVVVAAAVSMERGASALGHRYAVPGIVVGGLVLAAVTSLPNAVAAVYLAAKGRGAAAFSTALNSNTLNVVAGLLLPATFIGLGAASGPTILITGAYLGLTALTLGFAYAERGLRRWAGWVIIAGYVAFVIGLLAVS